MITCDKCGPGVQALMEFHLKSGLTLALCGHCTRRNAAKLAPITMSVSDPNFTDDHKGTLADCGAAQDVAEITVGEMNVYINTRIKDYLSFGESFGMAALFAARDLAFEFGIEINCECGQCFLSDNH